MKTGLSCVLSIAGLVSVSASLSAQNGSDLDTTRWSPALSMRYHNVSGLAMSPDGGLVAFVVRKPIMEGEKSEYRSHIWVVAADGSVNVQYTQGEKSATNPQFSPDGRYLAFTSSRSGENQVWLMRVRGGEAEQLTKAEAGVGSYRWSSDGTRSAYTMRDPDTEEEKEAKKEKRDVILVDQNFHYSHLYTVTLAKGTDGDRLTQRLTAGEFTVTGFDWSPDGGTIVFSHKADPRINTFDTDISTVPVDSGPVTALVTRPGADNSPRYSPDGRWVAFSSHGGNPERIGLGDAYVIAASGGEARKLADSPDRNVGRVTWSGDGSMIYFTEAVHTTRQLLALPVDGESPRQITQGDGVFGSFAFNAERDRMAFIYQDSDTPADVHVSPVRRFQMSKVADIHAGVPRPPMGRTILLSWASPDGRKIEGLLTYPVDYQQGRRYPLVLNVHGGPAGVYTQSFTGNPSIYMIQYFAEEGYAVLRPNPRGSSGYGKEFRYANIRDWGYGDFEDLMSGVDKVVDMGVAHTDSLLLMGWSYGGYMTSFAVTKTDRFKAASMGAGLPNLISMTMTTDIPDYLVAHMGAEFWEDYDVYEKHSAMYRIANVVTPTQVIHGKNDDRVPMRQGQEFYVALKRRGVPTEMIIYPRTPHGPREPKFVMDVSERIMTWFEKHLGREQEEPEAVTSVGGGNGR